MPSKTIAIANDHGGFDLKNELVKEITNLGFAVLDLGSDSTEAVDYPDFGYAMATAIAEGKATRGVLVCGSGIGISIAANRYPAIRAALIHDALGAKLSRLHNNANVIAFGGRTIGTDTALDCLKVFLETDFETADRHTRRVDKLSNPE